MLNEVILKYERIFAKLNRASVKGFKAPHKPILLISVIQSFAASQIFDNKIAITPELVARYKDNWNSLVSYDFFSPNFSLPFYHLKSEKFWHLQTYTGKEIAVTSSGSIKSFANLKDVVAYAYLNEDLYFLLQHETCRNVLYEFLLKYYFGQVNFQKVQSNLFCQVEEQILNDSPSTYNQIIREADEEEIFIRCGVFKKLIPKIYNQTCCISGMRIMSGYNIQMIDACHIIPFSVSQNDTISNGISLSPNFHRAFDRGLISIDNHYKVLVSEGFTESGNETSLKRYFRKSIVLPINKSYFPSLENLEWHRTNIFKS